MLNFHSTQEYKTIAALYNLGEVKNLSVCGKGLQTPKMTLQTSKGKFVVSKYRLSGNKDTISKSKLSLQHEIDLLLHLHGLPVPHYITSRNGHSIEAFGDAWITVDTFIPGKYPKSITLAMAYQLGQFLGAFHAQGKSFRTTLRGRRKFYDLNDSVMKKMEPYAVQQTHPLLKAVVQEVRQGVSRTRPPTILPKGPIHVDIKPKNELFFEGTLTGIVDFGNFYIDALMIDVGKTIMWNCGKGKTIDTMLVAELLKGYEEKRSFTKQERAYLPKAILFAIYSHIWVDLYHVPLHYVPESYTVSLVKTFLPIARTLEEGVSLIRFRRVSPAGTI